MLSIASRQSSIANVKCIFQLMDKIEQLRHSPPPIMDEEKPKEVFMLKKYDEQQQQTTPVNAAPPNSPRWRFHRSIVNMKSSPKDQKFHIWKSHKRPRYDVSAETDLDQLFRIGFYLNRSEPPPNPKIIRIGQFRCRFMSFRIRFDPIQPKPVGSGL